ncbi:MAG: tRNA (adenosine(37)-N6)-threonylcarbamoyltransferase complex dimerization subunit type 1 TsaB [Vicinamibacterales bacterium]
MLILALDTTTRAGSAALLDDDRVLVVHPGARDATHGERLPGELARVLDDARVPLASVGLLAVAAGPGGFTGIRIGLAAMQGLSMAIDRPVVGVSALDAMALAAVEQLGVSQARIGRVDGCGPRRGLRGGVRRRGAHRRAEARLARSSHRM